MLEVHFVGASLDDVNVAPVQEGDYCVGSSGMTDRNGAPFEVLVDGDTGDTADWFACNEPTTVGQTVFQITAPTATTQLSILFGRPLYAPGFTIYRDGVAVLHEDSNRGGGRTPSPVWYHYDLEGAPLYLPCSLVVSPFVYVCLLFRCLYHYLFSINISGMEK